MRTNIIRNEEKKNFEAMHNNRFENHNIRLVSGAVLGGFGRAK